MEASIVSAHPEMRFVCDRCQQGEVVTMQNVPTGTRLGGPNGWLLLAVGMDPSTSPMHLCPMCKSAFGQFMEYSP